MVEVTVEPVAAAVQVAAVTAEVEKEEDEMAEVEQMVVNASPSLSRAARMQSRHQPR